MIPGTAANDTYYITGKECEKMKNENLATDVYEYLIKKTRKMCAVVLVIIILLVATNCAWAAAYFRCKSQHEEYISTQEMNDAIIPDASPDGKRKRGR